ncbi:MAG: hypothetical protein Q7R41_15230, partial [Phycisphaerales bacterium]|nr:hypothetical protein [Phycisphaerales bacterium]
IMGAIVVVEPPRRNRGIGPQPGASAFTTTPSLLNRDGENGIWSSRGPLCYDHDRTARVAEWRGQEISRPWLLEEEV